SRCSELNVCINRNAAFYTTTLRRGNVHTVWIVVSGNVLAFVMQNATKPVKSLARVFRRCFKSHKARRQCHAQDHRLPFCPGSKLTRAAARNQEPANTAEDRTT